MLLKEHPTTIYFPRRRGGRHLDCRLTPAGPRLPGQVPVRTCPKDSAVGEEDPKVLLLLPLLGAVLLFRLVAEEVFIRFIRHLSHLPLTHKNELKGGEKKIFQRTLSNLNPHLRNWRLRDKILLLKRWVSPFNSRYLSKPLVSPFSRELPKRLLSPQNNPLVCSYFTQAVEWLNLFLKMTLYHKTYRFRLSP